MISENLDVKEEVMKSYLEVPGSSIHELPPLLLSGARPIGTEQIMDMANEVIVYDGLVPDFSLDVMVAPTDVESRKMGMAIKLVDAYLTVEREWRFGANILEWTRQCETTFECRGDLRPLLRPDLWPHASRSSFVTLLEDKAVDAGGINIQTAVGLRLACRRLPPLRCWTDKFLFFLKGDIAGNAYQAWAGMQPAPVSALPPERFSFKVIVL